MIVDREAGDHYKIKNPLNCGVLSYNNSAPTDTYLQRAREKEG